MLCDQGFDNFDDLLLLPPWQFRDSFKCTTGFAAWPNNPLRLWLAQYFVGADSKSLRNGHHHVRTWQVPARLPKVHVGGLLPDLPGKFTQRQARCLAEFAQSGLFYHAFTIKPARKKYLHVFRILNITVQCK